MIQNDGNSLSVEIRQSIENYLEIIDQDPIHEKIKPISEKFLKDLAEVSGKVSALTLTHIKDELFANKIFDNPFLLENYNQMICSEAQSATLDKQKQPITVLSNTGKKEVSADQSNHDEKYRTWYSVQQYINTMKCERKPSTLVIGCGHYKSTDRLPEEFSNTIYYSLSDKERAQRSNNYMKYKLNGGIVSPHDAHNHVHADEYTINYSKNTRPDCFINWTESSRLYFLSNSQEQEGECDRLRKSKRVPLHQGKTQYHSTPYRYQTTEYIPIRFDRIHFEKPEKVCESLTAFENVLLHLNYKGIFIIDDMSDAFYNHMPSTLIRNVPTIFKSYSKHKNLALVNDPYKEKPYNALAYFLLHLGFGEFKLEKGIHPINNRNTEWLSARLCVNYHQNSEGNDFYPSLEKFDNNESAYEVSLLEPYPLLQEHIDKTIKEYSNTNSNN